MSKRKILFIILSISLVLVISIGYFIGDYFVSYALVRAESGEVASSNDPNAPNNGENNIVNQNRELDKKLSEEWLSNVIISDESINSFDGLTLNAIQYTLNEPSDKWIIMVHGYTSSNNEMLNRAHHYGKEGYNVLMPNNRSHGNSEGTYIGMGWLDRLDIIDWIDKIIAENPNAEIVLYGISMGGATVLNVAGEELPSNVVAVIEDCGYTSAWAMFENQLDYRFSLPSFPVLDLAYIVANTRIGYDLKDADVLSQVKNIDLPVLFIHGNIDNYVPEYMVYELYDSTPTTNKELLIIENANHAESDYVNPELYYSTIFRFLDKHVN